MAEFRPGVGEGGRCVNREQPTRAFAVRVMIHLPGGSG
jgi:hypothetical protein